MSIVTSDKLSKLQPEALGFCRHRLAKMDQFRADQVTRGEMAGIVTLVARRGKIAHLSAIGYADLSSQKTIETNTLFRIYSMTKPVVAVALMMLYEEGRFQLADPVCQYIPELASLRVLRSPDASLNDTVPATRQPTIQDLLRHTAGFARGSGRPDGGSADSVVDAAYLKADLFNPDTSLADMMTKLAQFPLRHQPGTTWEYSISADIQARLIEILSGTPLDQFLQRRLFDPLGMTCTGYPVKDTSRLAAVHWWKDGKLVPCDDVHGYPDPTNYLLSRTDLESYSNDNAFKGGGNGLLSTVIDYWRFSQMLLNGGELDGQRILSPDTVKFMARDHLGAVFIANPGGVPSGMGFGLGVAVLNDPVAMGIHGCEGQYFWFGASHALFWIDPKEDLVVVTMGQHTALPPSAINKFHSEARAMIYGALVQ